MNLDKETQEKVDQFTKLLGSRFPKIEVASPGAPITVVATDPEDKQYYIRVDLDDRSINTIKNNGIQLENKDYYQLAQLMMSGANVFELVIFPDGFVLWFLNDVDKDQMKVTKEYTLIGVASALHIEDGNTQKYQPMKYPTGDGQTYYTLTSK